VTLLVIVAILVGVTTAASLVPAARAARVNPMTALRRE
jgi:ABC-type antimicrobial peptide transport system permease subunit